MQQLASSCGLTGVVGGSVVLGGGAVCSSTTVAPDATPLVLSSPVDSSRPP